MLAVPPALPLLLAAVGLVLAIRRPRAGLRFTAAGVVLAWALSTPALADLAARTLEAGQRPLDAAAWHAARDGPRPPRAIVVLGGGTTVDGGAPGTPERPTPQTLQRLVEAARVARLTGLPVLASGGAAAPDRVPEAVVMRELLATDLGTAVGWVEAESRDTAGNAAGSARMLLAAGIGSIVLVTHAYHMPRAQAAFERAGLVVLPAPHDRLGAPARAMHPIRLLPAWQAAAEISIVAHEVVGLLWYRWTGAA